MSDNPLYWDASYEIVQALMDAYPDADIETIGTEQLLRLIVTLPNFADDPVFASEGLLVDILREWYEEATA